MEYFSSAEKIINGLSRATIGNLGQGQSKLKELNIRWAAACDSATAYSPCHWMLLISSPATCQRMMLHAMDSPLQAGHHPFLGQIWSAGYMLLSPSPGQ